MMESDVKSLVTFFFFAVFLVTRFDIKVWIARFAGLNFKIVNQTKESGFA